MITRYERADWLLVRASRYIYEKQKRTVTLHSSLNTTFFINTYIASL